MLIVGVKASSSFEGVGFFRTASQPVDDPQPYMQIALASTLVGNEPLAHDTIRKWFNYNKEVNIPLVHSSCAYIGTVKTIQSNSEGSTQSLNWTL